MRPAPPPAPDPALVAAVPEPLARRLGALPLRLEDGILHVMLARPLSDDELEPLRVRVGALRVVTTVHPGTPAALLATYARGRLALASSPAAADAVTLLDALLDAAVAAHASDLHLDAVPAGVRVRLRIDGSLHDLITVASILRDTLVARIKVRAGLDVSERRLPQDGRFSHGVDVGDVTDDVVDVRVATLPTRHGERVTLRLLDHGAASTALDRLGLPAAIVTALTDAVDASDGLVLVCGPTGSGKTTTLHAALARVAAAGRDVVTLEDPVERVVPGTSQTQIDTAIGLTFARGLRHLLRHDPDVILVGEVRDTETALLAVEAAHTGHLVLASLHAVDAPGAVSRLSGLGAPTPLIIDTLHLVIAQRLLALPCPACIGTGGPTRCMSCDGTGTRGRAAIAEAIAPDAPLRARLRGISDAAHVRGVLEAACDPRLREVALARAAAGLARASDAIHATPDG
jgi:type II secretory ATPase GspE/PulE/Tfp pilus assembly ATPase PilB-like protein